jgi:hypothetical protein
MLYLFSDLRPKKLFFFLYFYSTLLYIIVPVSMVLQGRQNMYLGPFQNKILFQNKLLPVFLFCPLLKYYSLPILLSEQIVRK